MKKYIITKASTGSDWDSVSFALIEITKGLVSQVKRVSKILDKQKNLIQTCGIYADNATFFIDESELPENFDLEVTDETCEVIELSDEDFNKLSQQQQQLRGGEMRFSIFGNITFSTYGKNSTDEFWCDVEINFIKQPNLIS